MYPPEPISVHSPVIRSIETSDIPASDRNENCDLDGDGVKVVLLCGGNNALRKACFVLLYPREVSGHSPLTRDYAVTGYERARESAYLLLPRTVVGGGFRGRVKQNMAIHFSVRMEQIVVQAQDVHVPNKRNEPITATVWVSLNTNLSYKGILTGDDYDILYEQLAEEGSIPKISRAEALKDYGEQLLHLKNEEWVPGGEWTIR